LFRSFQSLPRDIPACYPLPMSNRYLVVSDLHLSDVEDHADGWKDYKAKRHLFDAEFAGLLERFMGRSAPGDQLTLVLNGDIFDFDLVTAVPVDPPWPISRSQKRRGLHPTAEKSAWKLSFILSFHPEFLRSLAGYISRGHRVVYVMGNHDREFFFDAVQAVFLDQLSRVCPGGPDLVESAVQFEPWFFYRAGEIYAEHGQQYDFYSSFRNLLWPVSQTRQGPMLNLPTGNLSNRYLMPRMGTFNPHASDYILNAFHYLMHWLKHYAFTRRSLVFPWFFGSISVILRILEIRRRQLGNPRRSPELMTELAGRLGLEPALLFALSSLQRRPIADRFFRMIREFWLDRVLIFLFMAGGTIALALVPIPLWIKLVVPLSFFPLVYFLYEYAARGESVLSVGREIPKVARAISALLPVRIVTMGHTHTPRLLPLSKSVTFVDTGTWAPIFTPPHSGQLAPGYRTYLLVAFEDPNNPSVEFGSWMDEADRASDIALRDCNT